MCLVSSSRRPRWEDDVTFAPRPRGLKNARRHVTETTTIRRRDRSPTPPPVIYVPPPKPITPPPPRVSTPVIRPITPPSPARIELVSVEEDNRSRTTKSRRRSGSRAGEEVYIERERERVRMPQPQPQQPEFETFRYVQGPERVVTESGPRRSSSRVVERERVLVQDGDRRREYYRRP